MNSLNAQVQHYCDIYESQSHTNALDFSSSAHLKTWRAQAIADFAIKGFPTTGQEEWKYTSVNRIAKTNFLPFPLIDNSLTLLEQQENTLQASELFFSNELRLVFVNGFFDPSLSELSTLPQGLHVENFAHALTHHPEIMHNFIAENSEETTTSFHTDSFQSLNAALFTNGVVIIIDKATIIHQPIHLVFITNSAIHNNGMTHLRNLVILNESSQATLIESHIGIGNNPYFTTGVTEIRAKENAHLIHGTFQQESLQGSHFNYINVQQEKNSHVSTYQFDLGGAFIRNKVNVALKGEGSECSVNGLYLTDGHQHVDNCTAIEHCASHTTSHEHYRGIIDGRSRAAFSGIVRVKPNSQKISANQTNRNLLLSSQAEIDTRPQLEIFADDIKCAHGATVGQLNTDALFYLQSRGISPSEAKRLMMHGFINDFIHEIESPILRNRLDILIQKHLESVLNDE